MELWPFIPQRRVTESLEWLTDVIRCKGAEQRFALRDAPRHAYAFTYIMNAGQYQRAKSLARTYSEEQLQVPVWTELTWKGVLTIGTTVISLDTRYSSFVEGGLVVVWETDLRYEVRTITALTDSTITLDTPLALLYNDALVMPGKVCTFAQAFEGSRGATDLVRGQARFAATEDQGVDFSADALEHTQLSGHDVLLDRAVLLGDINETHEREASVEDAGMGVVWQGAQYTYPVSTSMACWSTLTRQQLWELRAWLHTRKGKLKGFWLPSWSADFKLEANIGSSDTQLVVTDTRYRGIHTGTRKIMVRETNGTNHFLTVTASSLVSAGKERLTLSGATGFSATIAGVESVQFLTFVRFNADRVEIRHGDARGATVAIPTFETVVPA